MARLKAKESAKEVCSQD